MPGPENYNDPGIVFRVDPTVVWFEAAVELPKIVKIIHDSMDNIFKIWEGLSLGWNGNSAAEAKDFMDRFSANLHSLFGTTAAPSSGVLPRMATAAGLAAVNFGGTEDAVMRIFDSLSESLDPNAPRPRLHGAPIPGAPIPKKTVPQPPHRDVSGGQVDEDTP